MELTQEILKEYFQYNPETGLFIWKVFRGGGSPKIGTIAGTPHEDGYVKIKVNGKIYSAHRLAWLYMTGSFPTQEIDHTNGDGADNRFSNLREASRTENNRNTKVRKNNTSGFKRVSKNRHGKWVSHIHVEGRQHYLGSFDTPEAAHEAYCMAAKAFYGEFANNG